MKVLHQFYGLLQRLALQNPNIFLNAESYLDIGLTAAPAATSLKVNRRESGEQQVRMAFSGAKGCIKQSNEETLLQVLPALNRHLIAGSHQDTC